MTKRQLLSMLIFTLISALFGPAGCWNRREPEKLAHALAIGLDYDRQEQRYEVLLEVANLAAMAGAPGGDGGGGGGGGAGIGPSQVFSASGSTVFEALRRIETTSPRELFWAHVEVAIISEELSRSGLLPVLDFFARERQSRLTILPLVTGSEIKKMLTAQVYPGRITGEGLLVQYEAIRRTDTVVPVADLRTVMMHLSQPGVEIFIPRATLVRPESQSQQQGGQPRGGEAQQGQQQGGQMLIEISGGAAFRGDRMAGWLSSTATRGWYWITGEALRGTVVFPCPGEGEKHYISVEIFQSFSSIQPVVERGRPKIKLEITVEGKIQDVACYDHFLAGENPALVLNALLADALRSDIYAALGAAQELGSDIFGFGRAFHRAKPLKWAKFEKNWEEHFRKLEVEISVDAKIRRTGLNVEAPQQKR